MRAKKLENMTYGIIEKCCGRLLIGKTYWKQVGLSSVLHGTDVIPLTENEIKKLQIIENNMYRNILKASSYTPICTLRGEVGSSEMKSRVMKRQILYWRSIFQRNNELLQVLMLTNKCKLAKEVKKYIELLKMKEEDVMNKSEEWVKNEIYKYDTNE